jgi:flagellar L-ring protein precursor FlgH
MTHPARRLKTLAALSGVALAGIALAGCQEAIARPKFTPLDQTVGSGHKQLIATPVTIPEPPKPAAGSLWVPGSKQFFKDSRAHEVGDLITVVVEETAQSVAENKSEAGRTDVNQAGISTLPFISGQLTKRGIDLSSTGLMDTSSNRDFKGKGKNERKDQLSAQIAAVVTQVLPNGLLVIEGQREVLVNYEKQIMKITGIIRPEDITSTNTIPSQKVAEARIEYAGEGTMDDSAAQQWGVTLLNKILPF